MKIREEDLQNQRCAKSKEYFLKNHIFIIGFADFCAFEVAKYCTIFDALGWLKNNRADEKRVFREKQNTLTILFDYFLPSFRQSHDSVFEKVLIFLDREKFHERQ